MNVLVSTTHGFNIGDDLIRHGCQFILESLLGRHLNWFFWNRNPDLDSKSAFASNAVSAERLAASKGWDLVVIAGTPEWSGTRIRLLMEYLDVSATNIPVLFIGIGSAWAGQKADKITATIMRRQNSLTIVRNARLQQMLAEQNINAEYLPCPAFFCADYFGLTATPVSGQNLLTFQTCRDALYQSVPEARLNNALEAASRHNWQLVAHYAAEGMEAMQRNLPVRYAATAYDLVRIYATGRALVSTRLHGAVAGLSCGVPSIALGPDDFRISDAAAAYGDVLPVMNTLAAVDFASSFSNEEIRQRAKAILRFKADTRERYQTVLQPWLEKVMPAP